MGWFGGKGPKGSPVAKVYGQQVNEGQLSKVQSDRQLATEFLFELLASNFARVTQEEQGGPPGQNRMMPKQTPTLQKIPGKVGEKAREILLNIQIRSVTASMQMDADGFARNEVGIRKDLDSLRDVLIFERGGDKTAEYLALDSPSRNALDDLLLYLQDELYRAAAAAIPGPRRGPVQKRQQDLLPGRRPAPRRSCSISSSGSTRPTSWASP